MPRRKIKPCFPSALVISAVPSCLAFAPTQKRKLSSYSPSLIPTALSYAGGPASSSPVGGAGSFLPENDDPGNKPPRRGRIRPSWVPMELVELAAEDLEMSHEQFVRAYADVEAYTSCDDEGDDFHECDFFGHYLGPTKWLHLTPGAVVNDAYFEVWKDVWSRPHGAVDLADKVSKECLRYYDEFMLEPRTSTAECPTDRPLVRVKVVPASFGLEGFEDATWEATEDLMDCSSSKLTAANGEATSDGSDASEVSRCRCRAITFVAAAPDLFTDPILAEGLGKASPQAEFEPDRFREFASGLREKMAVYSRMEGVPLDDAIQLTPFHPMWRSDEGGSSDRLGLNGRRGCKNFPYPCVAVSTEIEL